MKLRFVINNKNCFFVTKTNKYGKIRQIIDEATFGVNFFMRLMPFYESPVNSTDFFGICIVSQLDTTKEILHLNDIDKKCFLLSCDNDKYLLNPIM